MMTSGFQCAGCGEWNETIVDSYAGTKQTYVEDCQVCCVCEKVCPVQAIEIIPDWKSKYIPEPVSEKKRCGP